MSGLQRREERTGGYSPSDCNTGVTDVRRNGNTDLDRCLEEMEAVVTVRTFLTTNTKQTAEASVANLSVERKVDGPSGRV